MLTAFSNSYFQRSFAAAAPMLWNDLPLNIKRSPSLDIFKSHTKTHLFQLAYFTWLFKCMCECLVMLLFHVMYFKIGRFSFCSYATRIFTSALVSKGQICVCNICPILKPALYKYHIIIIIININLHVWNFFYFDKNFLPKLIPNGQLKNKQALVQIMAWHWLDDKPICKPMIAASRNSNRPFGILPIILVYFV